MAVPRNRTSNARKNSRRSHHAKKPRALAACAQCGKPRMPHARCPHCSAYNGRLTVEA
jgi:large subunit ribosomal protein L32